MVWPDVADAAERRRIARDYQAWCLQRARRFHESLDSDAPPCPAELRLFAGDTVPTKTGAVLARDGGGRVTPRFEGDWAYQPGDGTVPRYSAVADRGFGYMRAGWLDSPVPWNTVTFLPDDHIGLTKDPVFTDNLLFQLLGQKPRRRPQQP